MRDPASILLLFEKDYPSWDAETAALAGEDPSSLTALLTDGLLVQRGNACLLTPAGEARRLALAQEMGCPVQPLGDFDADRALERCRLHLLLDRAISGHWAIKDFSVGEQFPIVPDMTAEELYSLEGGRLQYLWPQHPLIGSFLEAFPYWGIASRKQTPPGTEALNAWATAKGAPRGSVTFDLVLRNRYDFELYRKHPSLPTDLFHLQNADRLFCLLCPQGEDDLREVLTVMGRLHIMMLAQRRVYIPGYADDDSEDQENWTMMSVVTRTESELSALAERLRGFGRAMIEPALPMFMLGTSFERLRTAKPSETICDWFAEESVQIVRPDE